MPSIELKQLFNYHRLPEDPGQLFTFGLYAIIGCILFIIRVLLVLVVYILTFILPNVPLVHNFLHKLLNFSFGIIVQVDNPEKKEDVETYISNKISMFDASVVNFVTNSIMPSIKLNPLLSSVLGSHYFGSTNNIDDLKRGIDGYTAENKVPIFFQPEKIATNGKGLLKFNIIPFVLYNKVQPITLSAYRPIVEARLSTISSNPWVDAFWYMFVPCTVYRVKFLPVVEKKGMANGEFSNSIRQIIANELKVDLTTFAANDLREFQKRYLIDQQRANAVQRPQPMSSVNPELHQMTLQVREVLPAVPYNVVYKDLAKTRSVDVTITNILEGVIQYTPEQPRPSSSTVGASQGATYAASNASSAQSASAFNTGASVFGKSPQERTLSFHERKKLLIDNARRRYIEKHGLNIVGS